MQIEKLSEQKLSLSNDGTLTLFFTGVGSAFSKKQYQTNLLVIKGNDHLMIDCGTKTPQALFEIGTSVTEIQNYFITHSHADHIGGLEEVMLTNRYVVKKKPTIIIDKIYQHILWDLSLRGGAAFNEEVGGNNLGFGDLWNIKRPCWLPGYPRETYEAVIGSINLKYFRTRHIPDNLNDWSDSFWSCGVIIDNRILYTSDTKYDPDMLRSYCSLFPIETIFHDCQFFNGGVHASLDELCRLPESFRNRIVLVHYQDIWEQYETKIKENGFLGLGKQWHYYRFP